MRILLTGGAGLLGSELVHRLLKSGDEPVILDSQITPNFLASYEIDQTMVECIEADIRDTALVRDSVERIKPDLVIHFATLAGDWANREPAMAADVNCRATADLLDTCHGAGVNRVLLASSTCVYGSEDKYAPEDFPLSEDVPLWLSDSAPIYAASKLFVERLARHYVDRYGMEIAGMRPAFISAAGRPSRPPLGIVAGELIDGPALGRPVSFDFGDSVISYVYVADVASQYLALCAADAERLDGSFFNTGAIRCTVADLAAAVRAAVPDARIDLGRGAVDLLFGLPSQTTDAKFASTFGVIRQYDLRDGVRDQIERARVRERFLGGGTTT
jgi:nucleoside-diphosphate-sugar epimerase